jgi:hypothetical protein
MKSRTPDPVRIADLPPEDGLSRLAVLVESATRAPSRDLPLVKWRIRSTLRRRTERRQRALRVALIGMLMFVAGGVVGAVVQPMVLARIHRQAQPAPERPRPIPSRPHRHASLPPLAPSAGPAESSDGEATELPSAAEPAGAGPSVGTAKAPPNVAAPVAGPADSRSRPRAAARLAASIPSFPSTPPAATPSAPWVGGPAGFAGTPVVAGTPLVAGTIVATEANALNTPPALPAFETALPPRPGNARPSLQPTGTAASQPAPWRRPSEPVTTNVAGAVALDEQSLLTKALRDLRVARDSEAALAVLDEHRVRFPRGVLAPEAARLRVEALWMAGRHEAALAELDREPSDALPDREERHVLRGELHAKAGHWRLALGEFEAVLLSHPAQQAGPAWTADPRLRDRLERALWGRASARGHLGDDTSARIDLRDYLRRFPRGRFAAEAIRLVGERP